jgi:hypothetical protein
LRRRCFLHPEVIAASRNFVNVRLNIWLNEQNYQREHTLVSATYEGGSYTANTVFALFEPNAEGVQADSFPPESSMYYGTRVGSPYPACCIQPKEGSPEIGRARRAVFIRARRKEDLGEDTPEHLVERILWEQENGRDGPGLAKIMNGLAAEHVVKGSSKQSMPVLPLMPNLRQAINMGATDSRAVLVIVRSADDAGKKPKVESTSMDAMLQQLLFEEGIIGRMHAVVATPTEWAQAKDSGKVKGSERSTGIIFLRPGFFGKTAEVQTELPVDGGLEATRTALSESLRVFRETWRKLDREQLIKKGVADGLTWREWDPEAECINDVPERYRDKAAQVPKGDDQ